MKSYTDINQSEILTKILLLESADMYYDSYGRFPQGYACPLIYPNSFEYNNPCWSLAALLDVIPFASIEESTIYGAKTWFCTSVPKDTEGFESNNCDNPVDACVEIIMRLHELKML